MYRLLILGSLLMLVGCTAGSHHRGVPVEPWPVGTSRNDDVVKAARRKNAEHEAKATGVRYYRRSPYLLVHTDSRGGLIWRILYLPDPSKKMAIDLPVYASRLTTTLNFENGTLKDSTESSDATAVPVAVLAAIKEAIPAVVQGLRIRETQPDAPTPPTKAPAPYLFKIVVLGNTVELRGGPGDVTIPLPVAQ